jgi:mRNA-degrading endonuclease RelE of RelBE toxin-antitoxin system
MSFSLVHKPTFTNQLLSLDASRLRQVHQKIQFLVDDPFPDGKQKKKLHVAGRDVYRLRSGDFRIFYAIGDQVVALLKLEDRKEAYRREAPDVDASDLDVDRLDEYDDVDLDEPPRPSFPDYTVMPASPAASAPSELLPATLDAELLARLRVPEPYVPALTACRTIDDLTEVAIPEEIRTRVFDAVTSPNLLQVLLQPDLVTGDADDLLRYVEGELLGFLLRLSPEQERHVTRAVRGAGPTLVKGGPGTGKSTVALYRAKALVAALRADGIERPRLLFTTYTNALVTVSRQLLDRLLGEDAALVEVRTVDSVISEVVRPVDRTWQFADDKQLKQLVERAVKEAVLEGNALQRRAQGMALDRLGTDYLREEIESVIVARELATLDEYLQTPRAGREVALNASGRTAVWRVHERLERLLTSRRLTTWSRLRRRASELVRAGKGPEPYDGVLIDEAQDLEPAALRTLVGLCRSTDRLFVTADANQSIYGSGFRWTDVHGGLRFTGRTGILHKNYRSTQEIGEAAHAYLAYGAQDSRIDTDDADGGPREYVERGILPVMRGVGSPFEQAALLATFFRAAARDCRLGKGACAVLVPTQRDGLQVVGGLRDAGLDAQFMTSDALDLECPQVKVLTMRSAKGLEFPVVAIAGLLVNPAPGLPGQSDAEARREALRRARRAMFVGMTRAMRALLVVTPSGVRHDLLDGFDPRYWNLP